MFTPPHHAFVSRSRLAATTAVLLLAATSSGVSAAGTTEDFGPRLERTTKLGHFQVDTRKYIGQRFHFECPVSGVRDEAATLYGTDSYPADSPICVAAQHAGIIDEQGGAITIQLNPGEESYTGSTRFGISSDDFPGTALSFQFLRPETRSELDRLQAEWKPRLQWDDRFVHTGLANIRLTGQRFAFDCPPAPANLAGRRVYGTDRYPLNSYVCLSAVHAGQISESGGDVLLQMDPALEGGFFGSVRNGIESKNGAKSVRSLSFPNDRIAGVGADPAGQTPLSQVASAAPKHAKKRPPSD